jgi:hypothetical protein
MNVIWIAVAAFAGGVVASVLGWLDSAELFEPRKFSASIVRALVAAVAFAVGYQYANSVTPIDLGIAFCGGAGVDVLGNRISGAIKAGLK